VNESGIFESTLSAAAATRTPYTTVFSANKGEDSREKVRPKRFLKNHKCNEYDFIHRLIKKQEALKSSYFSPSRNYTLAPDAVLQLLRDIRSDSYITYKTLKYLRHSQNKTPSKINRGAN
jgi:hypothetical protein